MSVWNGNRSLWINRASAVTPQASWRFAVTFVPEGGENDALEFLSEEIISITLPTFKDTVVTRNFMNTRYSYITGRDITGTVTIRFNVRPLANPIYDILNMAHFNWDTGTAGLNEKVYLDFNGHRQFKSVEITMLPTAGDFAMQKQITLQNVLVVDYKMDDLNYENNTKVTGSVTLHYDNWFWSNTDHGVNNLGG